MKIIEATTIHELSDKIGSLTIPPQTLVRVVIEEVRTENRDSGKMLQKRDSISKKKALDAVGKFASGIWDISERHDDYLPKAYEMGEYDGE
jgi:hypothetical protein